MVIECKQLSRVFVRRQRGAGLKAALRAMLRPEYQTKRAVDDVTFTIPEPGIIGLVGANGAGKTTLLKLCAGLLHPSSGSARVLNHTPHERDAEFLRSIGMVMGQKSQLWMDIPALESFELLAAIYKIPEDVYQKRVNDLIALFEVKEQVGVQVRRLSLGERMKCEIIATLLHNPRLLILDEPTLGLDVVARNTLREFIRQTHQRYGTTIILSSHDMADISSLCERLLLIHNGKLIFDGALKAFENRYGSAEGEKVLEQLVFKVLSEGRV